MTMNRTCTTAIGAMCALALLLSACGTDDEEAREDTGAPGAGAGGPRSLGLLYSASGPAATAFADVPEGVDARLAAYQDDDGECADAITDMEVVEADDGSSPQGALTGMQRLVQQDDVYAAIAVTPMFFGASAWATSQGSAVPIIGYAQDGTPEYANTDDNLFPSSPVPNYDAAYTTYGQYAADAGGTKVAGVAFNQPASQDGLEQILVSMEDAGLERGYVNDSVPFGSTDVGPIVLGIIESGADVVVMAITPDTGLAVVAGLAQAEYDTEAILLPTGYSNDLLQSEPAVQAAQGVTFLTSITPLELESEATDRLRTAMQGLGSETGIPSYGQLQGWLTTDLFLHGLELSGCDASQEEYIRALSDDGTWNAGGLYPDELPMDTVDYDRQCSYFVVLEGDAFVPTSDEPVCGERI